MDGCGSVARARASDDDQDCCRICLEPYDERVLTRCLHSFCGQCIVEFIRSSPSRKQLCPICRQPVQESQLQKVTAPVLAASGGQTDANGNSAKITYLISQIKQHIQRADDTISTTAPSSSSSTAATAAAATAAAPSAAGPHRPFKCVVFSSWTKVLDIICDALKEAGIGFENFSKTREKAVEAFSADPRTHVLLVSMRGTSNSGAAGLTLTMASHAFLMEPMMNFGLEAQAIGRINRIGQDVPPTIERILVEETIEQQILRLAEKKRSLQAGGASAGDEAVKNAEVEEIFGL
jgi:E3 ubiquitin-protein ligase SHPRH